MPNKRLCTALGAALAVLGAGVAQTPVAAQAAAETETAAPQVQPSLEDLLWVARALVVFSDTPQDPRYVQQMSLLEAGAAELENLRVQVLTDAEPEANGPLRRALRPRGFGIVLIDTDGAVVQRRPTVTTVREIAGTVDRLPSRRQETGSRRQ